MTKNFFTIALIVVLSIVFRVFYLNETGLWMDEIHSAIGANPAKSTAEVVAYCKQDQPPLYFLLLHKWYKIFGYNDFVGRILGVITGILGIIGIYFLGVEFKNQRVGLFASFLTSINYFHIDYSRQVRFYPMVFFLSSISYLFFLRSLKNRKPEDFILYAISTAALLNTHYFGMVVFVSQFAIFVFVIFVNRNYDLRFIVWSLASATVAGLSFLHWIPVVLSDLQIPSYHLPQVQWYFPFQYYYVYFRDPVTCIVCGLLSLLAILEITKTKTRPLKLEYIVLVNWILLSFLIPILYSLFKMPMLEYKYTFIVVPAFFVLAAIGFDSDFFTQVKQKTATVVRLSLIASLIVLFASNSLLFNKLYFDRHPWQSWREVSQLVLKNDSEDQVALSNFTWYFRYYFNMYDSKSTIVEPRYLELEKLEDASSIWVITSTLFPDFGLEQDQQRLISERFVLNREEMFEDLKVKEVVRKWRL
ncbi:MAG: glycosyltransferase family 39 protein, partial [Flammeovirgaceae bacterium]